MSTEAGAKAAAQLNLNGVQVKLSKKVVRWIGGACLAAAIAIGNLYRKVDGLEKKVADCQSTLKAHGLLVGSRPQATGNREERADAQ